MIWTALCGGYTSVAEQPLTKDLLAWEAVPVRLSPDDIFHGALPWIYLLL